MAWVESAVTGEGIPVNEAVAFTPFAAGDNPRKTLFA
jgi:hypothetical protein